MYAIRSYYVNIVRIMTIKNIRAIGRVMNIDRSPLLTVSDLLKFSSIILPNISPKTIGAGEYFILSKKYPRRPNTITMMISKDRMLIAYAPTIDKTVMIGIRFV